jgi:hypothetical protein
MGQNQFPLGWRGRVRSIAPIPTTRRCSNMTGGILTSASQMSQRPYSEFPEALFVSTGLGVGTIPNRIASLIYINFD